MKELQSLQSEEVQGSTKEEFILDLSNRILAVVMDWNK